MGSIPTTSTNTNAAHRAAFLFVANKKGSDPFLLAGRDQAAIACSQSDNLGGKSNLEHLP